MSQPLATLLPNRGALILGGTDRYAFLQGLVSNDVHAVGPSSAIYAALLSPQGKFLHDMFVYEVGDQFILDCEAARADDLLKRLTSHKLRAKITIENVSGDYDIWAAWDEFSLSFMQKGVASASKSENVDLCAADAAQMDLRLGGDDAYCFADPRLRALGERIIIKKSMKPDNIRVAEFGDYDKHRITQGVPDGSRDFIVGKSTLAEGNLDFLNGISFTKGCYLGQELTARLHHRGLVKRRMFPVKITYKAPEFGAIIRDGADDVGDMRSAQGDVGLALLDIAKAQTQKTFTCGDSKLLVIDSFQKG